MTIHNETPPEGSEPGSVPTGLKRVVVASMAGTVVEWYEFFLYGTAATLVFNKVFFPAERQRTTTRSSRRSSPTRSASSPARSAAWCSGTSATSTAARSYCSSAFCSSAP